MAGGYFNDGAVNVELGAHAFATPAGSRRNVRLDPHGRTAVVLDSGGGILSLQVTGQRLRANLGDAERYIYEMLAALASSAPGTLGIEDQLGRRATFAQAVCMSGAGTVHAFTFANLEFAFTTPEKASEPAWGAVPAAPGTYVGTSTLQNYSAGGVLLGTHPEGMRIEMTREYPAREVPRARGARSRGPARGAHIRLIVSSHAVADVSHLADYLETLTRQIGPRPVDLTANGNTYADVVLDSLKPKHTDHRLTTSEAEFVKQV